MNEKDSVLDGMRKRLMNAQSIAIAGHINPDGDAIGACLALGQSLRFLGKTVSVLLEGYAPKYRVIPGDGLVITPEAYNSLTPELFVVLDCGGKDRLGAAAEVFDRSGYTLNIDHHVSNQGYAQLNFVEPEASSTSELIYDLLKNHFPLDKEIASALYAGILYDTGGFRHSSTSPQTMAAAGELMAYGIPFSDIYHAFFDRKTFSELKIMGTAIANAKLAFSDQLVYSTITGAEIAACGGNNKELDTVVSYLKGVEGTKVSCFLYEKGPEDVKASFRSGADCDVAALAEALGGGGHKRASGCTLRMPITEALEKVLAEMKIILQ